MTFSRSYRRLTLVFLLRASLAFVGVCALGIATPAQDPSNYVLQTGRPSFSTIDRFPGGFVNIANGNMHLEIPLGSYPQRGSVGDLGYKLVYDSRVWVSEGTGAESFITTMQNPNDPDVQELPFFGWSIVGEPKRQISGTPFLASCNQPNVPNGASIGPVNWQAPDGTKHHFDRLVATIINCNSTAPLADGYSTDGAGYHLFIYLGYPNVVIYSKDGSLVYTDPTPNVNGTMTSPIRDANGNKITWTYTGPGFWGPKPVTDTLGRAPITSNIAFGTLTLNTLNSQNAYSPVAVLKFGALGVLYPDTGNTGVSPFTGSVGNVLESITLADGSVYSFTYDCDANPSSNNSLSCDNHNALLTGTGNTYGLMTSAKLPTGGTVSFTYANFTDSDVLNSRNRWLTGITYGGGQWTYTPATGCGSFCQTITVARPSGAHDVYTFDTISNISANNTRIDYYNGAVTGTPSLTVQNVFEAMAGNSVCVPVNGVANNCAYAHLKSSTTTVPAPGGNLVSQTSYVYDSFLDTSSSPTTLVTTGKLLSKTEYAFGVNSPGLPLRKTVLHYLDDANANYRSTVNGITNNIMDRVTDVQIQDGSGNIAAETKTTYDSNLTGISGIQNHDDTNFGTSNTFRGNPTLVQQLVSGTTFLNVLSLNYDTTGQITQISDALGNATTLGHADKFYVDSNPAQNPPSTVSAPNGPTNAYLTQVTVPLIGASSYGYYLGSGKQAFSVDPNGADSYSHYLDSLDRLTHSYAPLTNGARGWTLQTYSSGSTQMDTYTAISDPSRQAVARVAGTIARAAIPSAVALKAFCSLPRGLSRLPWPTTPQDARKALAAPIRPFPTLLMDWRALHMTVWVA